MDRTSPSMGGRRPKSATSTADSTTADTSAWKNADAGGIRVLKFVGWLIVILIALYIILPLLKGLAWLFPALFFPTASPSVTETVTKEDASSVVIIEDVDVVLQPDFQEAARQTLATLREQGWQEAPRHVVVEMRPGAGVVDTTLSIAGCGWRVHKKEHAWRLAARFVDGPSSLRKIPAPHHHLELRGSLYESDWWPLEAETVQNRTYPLREPGATSAGNVVALRWNPTAPPQVHTHWLVLELRPPVDAQHGLVRVYRDNPPPEMSVGPLTTQLVTDGPITEGAVYASASRQLPGPRLEAVEVFDKMVVAVETESVPLGTYAFRYDLPPVPGPNLAMGHFLSLPTRVYLSVALGPPK